LRDVGINGLISRVHLRQYGLRNEVVDNSANGGLTHASDFGQLCARSAAMQPQHGMNDLPLIDPPQVGRGRHYAKQVIAHSRGVKNLPIL
jgi:hypothetical protein